MSNRPLKTAQSDLTERRWAVISAYYINVELTHAEALRDADDLRRRGQLGAIVVTNATAQKLLQSREQTYKKAA